jgi:hypothetical protein
MEMAVFVDEQAWNYVTVPGVPGKQPKLDGFRQGLNSCPSQFLDHLFF